MADDLRIDRRHVIPATELEERASRSSGPGGQGVNTTDSAVELRWQFADSVALSDAEKAPRAARTSAPGSPRPASSSSGPPSSAASTRTVRGAGTAAWRWSARP